MMSKGKTRLDQLLVDRKEASNLKEASKLIMAGKVRVDDAVVDKPGKAVNRDANLGVEKEDKFVSRGGHKLEAALDHFQIEVGGKVCADVGCSVGGFSDLLLQRGAAKVYAIDTAYGDLAWKVRNDPRVVVMERTNAAKLENLPQEIDLAVVDISLVSLNVIVPSVANWLKDSGEIVALIKPQYEYSSKGEELKGGVFKEPGLAKAIADNLVSELSEKGFKCSDIIESPIKGMQGNQEFLVKITA